MGSGRRRDVLVIAMGLLVGIGGSVLADDALDLVRGDGGSEALVPNAGDDVERFDEVVPASSERIAPTPAPSPSDAIEGFLTAEASGQHEQSFALLTEAGRDTYGSPATWQAAHASFFPVAAFEMQGVNHAGSRTSVVTDVRYESTINEVIGLVPARAEVTWLVVEEGGGWLVDFDGADVAPRFPPDRDAVDAARRWATTRQDCRVAEEYSAGLVGLATIADRLCDADGPLHFGPVASLDSGDTSALVSAFGAPAATWARAVDITGPVEMTVVLAPVDDTWLVVGVVDAR